MVMIIILIMIITLSHFKEKKLFLFRYRSSNDQLRPAPCIKPEQGNNKNNTKQYPPIRVPPGSEWRGLAALLPADDTLFSILCSKMPPALQPGPVCLLLSILSFLRAHAQPADTCARVRDGQIHGTVLVGHVISTQAVQFFQECADLCEKNPSCFSVNYYDTSDTCELNDRTSFHNPEHMILKHGRYLDIHRPYTDCSDFFCSSDRVCKMDRVDRHYCKGISIYR